MEVPSVVVGVAVGGIVVVVVVVVVFVVVCFFLGFRLFVLPPLCAFVLVWFGLVWFVFLFSQIGWIGRWITKLCL